MGLNEAMDYLKWIAIAIAVGFAARIIFPALASRARRRRDEDWY